MGAMAFLPTGFAIGGPVAAAIDMSTSLWMGRRLDRGDDRRRPQRPRCPRLPHGRHARGCTGRRRRVGVGSAVVPRVPVPPDVDEFLSRPNPAVVATLRPDGSPHAVATWYDWEDGRVLLNMDASRLRLRFMRDDPRVALTVLDDGSCYRHVSLIGRVVSIADDPELVDIDRLARRYTGRPFGTRDEPRVSAWVEPDRWHGWHAGGAWGT
jgi:PPOX class probable F420-dependent enzyme